MVEMGAVAFVVVLTFGLVLPPPFRRPALRDVDIAVLLPLINDRASAVNANRDMPIWGIALLAAESGGCRGMVISNRANMIAPWYDSCWLLMSWRQMETPNYLRI